MPKSEEVSRAAQLIKQTAQETATALNIQYIQRDISDLKSAYTKLAESQDGKAGRLETQIQGQAKIIYMGIGASMAFSIFLPLLVHFFVK